MSSPTQTTKSTENPNVVVEDAVVQNQPQIQDVAEEGVVFRLTRALRVRRRRRRRRIRRLRRQMMLLFDSDDEDEADYDWSNFISGRAFRYDYGF